MATAGKGLPFIGKMNEYLGRILHPTVNKVGNSIAALDVKSRAYFCVNGTATPLTVGAGSDDNLLNCTGLNAKAGDIIRILTSANSIKEFEITVDEAPDANSAILAGYLSADLAAGDTFHLLRPVHELVSSDGSTLATVISPPIQYNRKSGGVTTATTVLEDLDTPTASRALPVVIHSIDGAPIIVNAGDLSVSINHTNDSVRLGDGITLTGVTLNNELKTHDADLLTNLGLQADAAASTDTGSFSVISFIKRSMQNWTALLAKIPALVGGKIPVDASGTNVTVVQPTAANLNATVNLITGFALETTQTANGVLLGAVNETAPATDTASSGLNGRLQRIAQRITSLIALFPTALGQGTMAQSFKVVLASDHSTIVVSETATTNMDTNLGAKADAVATTDTGTFSLIALTKKIAQNITAMSAKLPAALGITTAANSLSIAPASDAIFNVKPKALTNSYDEKLTLTTVSTFTAPANAIGGKIMAQDTNGANVRYKQNGTATTTSGMQLQPGRAEDFMGGQDITVVSESGTNAVFIQWTIQA